MPVWNRAHIIHRALDSLRAQKYQNFEVIIVDDGSEDDLPAALEKYKDLPIRYFRIDHQGVAAARNFAIKQCTTPFIAYLDSDNAWQRKFLLEMAKALSRADSAYCAMRVFENVDGKIETKIFRKPFEWRQMLSDNKIDMNTFCHRRKVFEKVPGFDESFKRLVDYEFLIKATLFYPPIFVDKILVDYYRELEDNCISKVENFNEANAQLNKMRLPCPVSYTHDAITFRYNNLPRVKLLNFLNMRAQSHDFDNYRVGAYPYQMQVEPTTMCNLKCTGCPTGQGFLGRPKEHMPFELFEKFINDMKDYLMMLILWEWGEPFMYPDLPRMVRHCSQHDIRTMTSTNAHFIHNEKYLLELFDAGLSVLIIAIDSLKDEEYEKFRRTGKLSTVKKALSRVVNLRNKHQAKTEIVMRSVALNVNEDVLPELEAFAKESGVDKFVVKTLNPDYNADDSIISPKDPELRRFKYKKGSWERIKKHRMCDFVWNFANIHVNGDVIPCCYDYSGKNVLGNVKEQAFPEIWMSEKYVQFRKDVEENRENLAFCNECHYNFDVTENYFIKREVDFREEK